MPVNQSTYLTLSAKIIQYKNIHKMNGLALQIPPPPRGKKKFSSAVFKFLFYKNVFQYMNNELVA